MSNIINSHIDIVVPKDNEHSFIDMAQKLGYSHLCFIYDHKQIKEKTLELNQLQKKTSIKLHTGVIGPAKTFSKMHKLVDLCLFDASFQKNEIIRNSFENKICDIVFNLEINPKKDHTHYPNSGLDQVLCRIAKNTGKIICFNFNNLLSSSMFVRAKLLSRVIQNIKLCKKYKLKISIASFATSPKEMRYFHDLASLLVILNAQPKDAKNAQTTMISKIKNNQFKKSDKYICEGLTLV